MQGVFALMLIFGLFSVDLPFSSAQTIFNVLDYGAKADGKKDDSNVHFINFLVNFSLFSPSLSNKYKA